MVIFTSIYNIVDGLFVSRFVGKVSFAAINMDFPILMILGAFGSMIGTGGAAIVGKTLGEGDNYRANQYFSMLIYSMLIIGAIFAVAGFFILPEILKMLGAQGELLNYSVLYGRIVLVALPFFITEFAFQSFFVTAEKPQLGLYVTIFGGVLNILLDALFIVVFGWGLTGAALATVAGQISCVALELFYFARKNDSLLHLTLKTKFYRKIFFKSCTNGASEIVNTSAMSIVSMLYNYQLIKYIGENGVAAYGVIMYVAFIFAAIFFGYEMGVSPAVSYQYGAKGYDELKNLLRKSLIVVGVAGVAMFTLAQILAAPFSNIFVGYDTELYNLTVHAFRIQIISILFLGFSSFGSAFFTALNNGVISAVISFVHTFIFEIGCVLLLPLIFGIDGIWYSIVVAEIAASLLTFFILYKNRKKYHYA
jgi:putative MATE family efflux protein